MKILKKLAFWIAVVAMALIIVEIIMRPVRREWRKEERALARSQSKELQSQEEQAADAKWKSRNKIGFRPEA
jgi:hypothetical protein